MNAEELMGRLQVLHQQAKRASLRPEDRPTYDQAKEVVARALCAAQRLALSPGQAARTAFRVAILFKVELSLGGSVLRTVTMDASLAGFSALLPSTVPPRTEVAFKMMLKDAAIAGHASVAGTQRTSSSSSHQVSFSFSQLAPADAARLELALFDAVLLRAPRAL